MGGVTQVAAGSAASSNLRGASLMILAAASHAACQGLMRWASPDVPFLQAMFLQSFGALTVIAITAGLTGQIRLTLHRSDAIPAIVYAGAETALGAAVVASLYVMGVGQVSAILQGAPAVVTLAAIMILREPAGVQRIAAVLFGLAGVILILHPGSEIAQASAVLPLLAIFVIVVRDMALRRVRGRMPPIPLALMSFSALTVASGVTALATGWETMPVGVLAKLFASSGCLAAGVLFSLRAVQTGDLGFVVQFRYCSLLFALLIGWLAFGERHDPMMLLGCAIVVSAGLWQLSAAGATARFGLAKAAQRS